MRILSKVFNKLFPCRFGRCKDKPFGCNCGTFIGLSAGAIGTAALIGGSYALSRGGNKKEEISRPSYADLYKQFFDPRAKEITGDLYDFGKSRLDPSYQAISPEQQSMIFKRIQGQLQPGFEEQLEGQRSDIYAQGIEGTPGSAILSNLRQSYLDDLSGRATDIAIEDISRTEAGRQYGGGLLERLRGSLTSDERNIAGAEYGFKYLAAQATNCQILGGSSSKPSLSKKFPIPSYGKRLFP